MYRFLRDASKKTIGQVYFNMTVGSVVTGLLALNYSAMTNYRESYRDLEKHTDNCIRTLTTDLREIQELTNISIRRCEDRLEKRLENHLDMIERSKK